MASPSKMPTIAAHPSRHVYDVIVVGGQVGGALSAALMAKRGYRVLLVDHDGMGAGYEHGDYLLPYAPFIMPPLKGMPAVEEAFTELGLTTTLQRALKPSAPDLQLVLPQHRLDLHHDDAKRLAELSRELGPDGATANAAIQALDRYHEGSDALLAEPLALPPDGMMETWGLKSIVRRHPTAAAPLPEATGPAVELLLKLQPFMSYLAQPEKPLAVGRPISHALRSPGRYPGGMDGLRELLCKRLVDLGGDVLGQESDAFVVESLAFEGDKVMGIKLLRTDTLYRSSAMVAATDSGALRRLIVEKKRQRKLTELLDLSSTHDFLFTVNWVVQESVLPRGMGEQLLLSTEGDLGPVLIQLHPARRPGKPDDETHRVVCAGAFVPATARDLGEPHLKALADRLSDELDRLMPFARSKVAISSAPYLDAGGVRGSRLLPHALFKVETEQILGVEGLNQRTPVKNLFLANREVLPGLGLEGELMAGIRSARLVQEMLKKRDPLKR